jgi:hypothetical protein
MTQIKHKMNRFSAVTIFCFSIILISGCSKQGETSYVNNATSLAISNAESEKMSLSTLSDSISYVLLDTPEELAIGQIDRILLSQNRFFVLDRDISSALFVFDLNGKLIFDIQEGIGGPGEVREFSDFDVSEQAQELYILDNESKDIKVFNFFGEFIESIRLSFFAASINVLSEEIAVFRNNQFIEGDEIDNDQIAIINKEGKVIRSFLPLSSETNYLSYHDSFRPLQSSEKSWIFSQALNDTIYEISGSTAVSKYVIDFGNKSLTKIEAGFFGISDFLQSERRKESLYLMGDTFETSDYLLSLFYAGKSYKYVFYDKLSNKASVVDKIDNDLDYVPYLHTKFANDQVLIADLPAELLLSLDEQIEEVTDKTKRIRELVNDPIFEKENPILMIVHLRSRK